MTCCCAAATALVLVPTPCLLESAASQDVYVWPKGRQKFGFLPVCFPQPNSFGGTPGGAPLGDAALLVAVWVSLAALQRRWIPLGRESTEIPPC